MPELTLLCFSCSPPNELTADLCFLTEMPLTEVAQQLQGYRATIVEGPLKRTKAVGPFFSLYFPDPDSNLLEVSNALPFRVYRSILEGLGCLLRLIRTEAFGFAAFPPLVVEGPRLSSSFPD